MPRYTIEAAGRFTRDFRWFELEADNIEAAKEKFANEHSMYRLTGISRLPAPPCVAIDGED